MTNLSKPDQLELLYRPDWINQYDVVSFDIFDTLLIRDTDTHFKLWRSRSRSFAYQRTFAEVTARVRARFNHIYEIDQQDIYRYMPRKWHLKDEVQLEDDHLFINPEILRLIMDMLGLGKKIVLVSDTHFDSTTLLNWLTARGLPRLKVFTSQEFQLPKSRGLFEKVRTLESIDVSSWLHIGDNEISDYQAPRKLGISALHYPKIKYQVIETGVLSIKALNWFLKKGPIGNDSYAKFLSNYGLVRYESKRERLNSLELLGAIISAPIANAIAKQVATNHQFGDETEYWFVSRDGWLPYLAFLNTYPNKVARYFKTSRKMLNHEKYDEYIRTLVGSKGSVVLYDLGWRGSTLKRLRRSFPKVAWKGEFFGLLNTVAPPVNVLFSGTKKDFLSIWRARDLIELIFSDQSQGYISLDSNLNPIENAEAESEGNAARLSINEAAETFINKAFFEMDMSVASLLLTGFVKYPASKIVGALKDEKHEIVENRKSPLIHSNWKSLFSAQQVMWPQAVRLFRPKFGQPEQLLFKLMCLAKESLQRITAFLGRFKINR